MARAIHALWIAFLLATATTASANDGGREVRLVLQITVDGLRGDLLRRYGARFGKDGFRRLSETGVNFTNAH